ncbi:RNA 2',3'-cyclic phosphodiesterase [uncultured Photobacterium sp.]|uniref:RNA 2',3'-cyclic phosphodiesterase n=1 Tax=uncultured Photobacterium sp. TaxID=173973 RepID=UPI00261F1C8E|nr:RNA 2',3'-cyclic phosphodiesterase [uncultured Photobacterium sp.]
MMNKNSERLFFALALDSPAENKQAFRQLCHFSSQLPEGGHRVPNSNLHLTLAFLGQVNPEQKTQLSALAKQIVIPPFSLSCSTFRYWKRSKILWLGSENVPEPLYRLASELKQAALQVGLTQDERDYAPHITLKKQVPRRPEPMPDSPIFTFHFQHFGLYISQPCQTTYGSGVEYRCLQQWPLART